MLDECTAWKQDSFPLARGGDAFEMRECQQPPSTPGFEARDLREDLHHLLARHVLIVHRDEEAAVFLRLRERGDRCAALSHRQHDPGSS